jgi:hypothetical protein
MGALAGELQREGRGDLEGKNSWRTGSYCYEITSISYDRELQLGYALAGFLFDLIDYDIDDTRQPVPRKNPRGGTIISALNAANTEFVKHQAPDAFVLVKGDASKEVFPNRPKTPAPQKVLILKI